MTEYLLLLLVSIALLVGSFANGNGPVAMFTTSAPVLATRVERQIITGEGFFEQAGEEISWKRR